MSNYRNDDLAGLAEAFAALSNPHRLTIFLRLAACCSAPTVVDSTMRECVGALAAGLDIAASTVSHHLKELRRAGLIHMERRGRKVECWVDAEVLERLSAFFAGARAA